MRRHSEKHKRAASKQSKTKQNKKTPQNEELSLKFMQLGKRREENS